MDWLHSLYLEVTALLGLVLTLVTIPWVLMSKRESTSAVAWCLLVFFLPILGSFLFLVFGWQHDPSRGDTEIFVPTAVFPPGSTIEVSDPGLACHRDEARQLLVCRGSVRMTIGVKVTAR